MTKHREIWADFLKGIGILLVFIGHIDNIPQILRIFIYLFHMPIFFFCTGYYVNINLSFKEFAFKKFKRLLIPYFFYCMVVEVGVMSIVVPIVKSEYSVSTVEKKILSVIVQARGMGGDLTNWFLTATFVASIMFYIFRKTIHNVAIEFLLVVSIAFVVVSINRNYQLYMPWYVDVVFPCLIFVYLGYYTREKQYIISNYFIIGGCIGGAVASFVIKNILGKNEEKFIVDYHLLKLQPFVLVVVAGGVMCLALYGAARKITDEKIMTFIGKNSILYYLFDWVPTSVATKFLYMFNITSGRIVVFCQFVSIIILMPIIIVIVKNIEKCLKDFIYVGGYKR